MRVIKGKMEYKAPRGGIGLLESVDYCTDDPKKKPGCLAYRLIQVSVETALERIAQFERQRLSAVVPFCFALDAARQVIIIAPRPLYSRGRLRGRYYPPMREF